jgi:hypothetical protein
VAGRGGNQPPANPAPVSGPGSLSQRTDGGPTQPIRSLPNAKYGENKDFVQLQQAAPLAGGGVAPPVPGAPPDGGGQSSPQMPTPQPLTGGTVMPGQPVTHGADSGPGPGSAVLGQSNPMAAQYTQAKDMVSQLAASPSASPALRQLASKIGQTY